MFLKLLFRLTYLLINRISVDVDLCITSSSNINLAFTFGSYPIRIFKPSDVNLICPLKLNGAIAFNEYSICATFKCIVENLMNCFDVIVIQASASYLCYSYYRLHVNYSIKGYQVNEAFSGIFLIV